MPAVWSATEAAFFIIAVLQAVFAVIWACGAWWVQSSRPALAHWAAWSALGSITWLILAAKFESPPLFGILLGVLTVIALQRGIRYFIGREPPHQMHLAALAIVMLASPLADSQRHLQAGTNFGVLALLNAYIAYDLYRHAQEHLRMRWPVVLAAPLLLGSLSYGARAVRALAQPESVLAEMAADSALNLGGAITYIVLVLALHATLVALVVGRLVDELRKLSLHDALTGLLNRRAMEETLHAQIRSSKRSGQRFALMMLDLDYFKRINDAYGHAIGDLALQHVSALLKNALRDVDHLARFGGEEFVVLMPDASRVDAEPVAERLRTLLASKPLAHEGIEVSLSVSIGIAEWRGADDNSPALLQRADAALFQAKVQGRNRVVSADESALVFQT